MGIYQAALLSSIPFYASFIFIYAGTFYSHVLVALLLVLAYRQFHEKASFFTAGLFTGAAFLSEYLAIIFVFIWAIQLWHAQNFKKASLFLLGTLPFGLIFLWYNYETTGNLLKTTYTYHLYYNMENAGFTWPSPKAMFMMLFSPWRGILFYMPVFITFIPWISKKTAWRFAKLTSTVLLPSLLFFVAVASFKEWHGGWTFGPRYLIPALGLVYYHYAPLLSFEGSKKWWLALPLAFGLVLSLADKLTVLYSIPSEFKNPFFQVIWPALKVGRFNNGAVLNRITSIDQKSIAILFLILLICALLSLKLFYRRIDKNSVSKNTS
jgi:hypothetical protein